MDRPNPLPAKKAPWKRYFVGCAILLAFGIALVGIAVYVASPYLSHDPTEVEAVARELLTFKVPDGFEGHYSRSIPMHRAASFKPREATKSLDWEIILVERTGKDDSESLRKRTQAHQENHGGSFYVHDPLPSESFKVRGKETSAQIAILTVVEGRPKQREYKFVLDGKSGALVLLTILGPDREATHEWVQAFLDSVK